MTVYVDQRWDGFRGITRYAREITSRLAVPHAPWTSRIGPTSPVDVVAPARMQLAANDLLYSPGFSAGWARCRQLITLHDLIHMGEHDRRSHLHRAYYNRVVRPAIQKTGHVLTVSEASRSAISDWLGDESISIHVTGEGTSAGFTPDGEAANFDRPYFLFVGNMRAHKNPELFFAAMAGLRDHRAVVVTSDPERAEALAGDYGLAPRCTVLTGIEDQQLARLYRGAEALVFTSLQEGFGLPVLEAVSCGCPVVHYAGCASVVEILGPTRGAVDSTSDAEAWRAVMETTTRSADLLVSRANGHTWDSAARKVDCVIKAICDD